MDMAAEVIEKLKGLGLTLSCAESCTGGMLADAFVSVSGASAVFLGSLVAYDERVKAQVLKVSPEALAFGAVSEACARDMAARARKLFNSDIALSTTGYADKSDRPDVEDGTIYVALSASGAVFSRKLVLKGARNENRRFAADAAVEMLNAFLAEKKI